MLKFVKILFLIFSIILLFTTISLATFTPDDLKSFSSSNEFQPISIIDSILDEYENNADDNVVEDENYKEDDDYDENETSSGGFNVDALTPKEEEKSGLSANSVRPNYTSTDEITSLSSKISNTLSILGIFIIILPIICIVCGILYMLKSKASKFKKIIIGIVIILTPFIVFTIGAFIIILL